MPITRQLVELTHEELQLMVQNIDSKDVVSNPLERFIMYSSIIAAEGGSTINIKYIQAQSHQSFYRCNLAVKKLIKMVGYLKALTRKINAIKIFYLRKKT